MISRIRKESPLAALRSRFSFFCLDVCSLRGLSKSLLHRETAEPVSSSALTVFPPTEMFTIGLLSPWYRIEVRRLKQVSMHWGRFLLNTFPRDRFPTPGIHCSHILRIHLHVHRIHLPRSPILHRHNPIGRTGRLWEIGVYRGMLQN